MTPFCAASLKITYNWITKRSEMCVVAAILPEHPSASIGKIKNIEVKEQP